MEPLTIIQGMDSLLNLSKFAFELYRRFKDAPADLKMVGSHLRALDVQLRLLNELHAETLELELLESEIRQLFISTVNDCRQILISIHDSIAEWSQRNHGIARLEWTVLGKGKVEFFMLQLGKTERMLNDVMTALQLVIVVRQARRDNAVWMEIKASLSTIHHLLLPFLGSLKGTSGHNRPQKMSRTLRKATQSYQLTQTALAPWCHVEGTFVKSNSTMRSTYVSCFRLSFPQNLTISIYVLLWVERWFWPRLHLHRTPISPCYRVAPSAAIMVAAAAGDVIAMRRLLSAGDARPNDETVGFRTPLDFAITSGNPKAVGLLLENGADANRIFGEKQTSPLAWALKHRHLDVARLLMTYKASFHHLNVFGWSPLFYLWSELERHPCSDEFLSLLSCDSGDRDFSWLHAGIVGADGWGLIHRAAVFGTPEDVKRLVSIGVDPYQKIGDLGWTALHLVAYYGIYDVLLALLTFWAPEKVNLPDDMGWTPLHIAAAEGHDDITCHLLELKVDPQAKTAHTSVALHEEMMYPFLAMKGDEELRAHLWKSASEGCWTPRELAFLHDKHKGERFEHLLQSFLDDQMDSDVWYDAVPVLGADIVVPRNLMSRMKSRLTTLMGKLKFSSKASFS